MSDFYVVREVVTPQDFQQFFEFPWVVNKHNPNWVPPLVSARKKLLDKQKNPSWEYMDGVFLAAWRGWEMVGTVVAFVNHRHNAEWREKIGWIGMFECIDNQQVANQLLGYAENWLRLQGVTHVKGPQSFTTHEETGLLLDNFDPPSILMPWNPKYYQKLLENAGYAIDTELYSFQATAQSVAETGMLNRIEKIIEHRRKKRKQAFRIRPFNMDDKHADFQNLRQIYAEAWDKNWGFVTLTNKELDSTVDDLGQLIDPRLAFFAEVEVEPGKWELAGMAIAVQDMNRAIHWAKPRPWIPELLTLLLVGLRWKVWGIKQLRLALLGVMPNHREKGIDLALIHAVTKSAIENGFNEIDCGWVLKHNQLVDITLSLGLKHYKTHAWFVKKL